MDWKISWGYLGLAGLVLGLGGCAAEPGKVSIGNCLAGLAIGFGGFCEPVSETYSDLGYRQHMEQLIGLTSEALQAKWGPPDKIVTLSDGRNMLVYRHVSSHHQDADSGTETRNSTETYKDSNGKSGENFTMISTPYESPELSWSNYCETRFVIGSDGKVETFGFNGGLCTGTETRKR